MSELLSRIRGIIDRREQPVMLHNNVYPVGEKRLSLSHAFGAKFVALLEQDASLQTPFVKPAQKVAIACDDPVVTGAEYVRRLQPKVIVGGAVAAGELAVDRLEQLVAEQLGLPTALANQSAFRDRLVGRQGVMVLVIIEDVCNKDTIDDLKCKWGRVSREGQLVIAHLADSSEG